MKEINEFKTVFKNYPQWLELGLRLRELVFKFFPDVDESISGGEKVKLALYSRNGDNNVLCGIQPGVKGCMLYVHHIDKLEHERLTFSGKGKHAKRINFETIDSILEEDIKWLFEQVQRNAPF